MASKDYSPSLEFAIENETYEFKPLQDVEGYRIMRLERGETSQLIQFSLHHQNSSDLGSDNFFALSYACGNLQDTQDVLCNGRRTGIYKSLYKALQAVRLVDTPIAIWADCICINQKDLVEKSKQVSCMWRIYRDAFCTLIWIGDSMPSTELALRTMRRVVDSTGGTSGMKSPISQQPRATKEEEPGRTDGPGTSLEKTKPTGIKLDAVEYEAILKLFGLSWFSRIWCAQEVCLSPGRRPPIVFHGNYKFPWPLIINYLMAVKEAPSIVSLVECSHKHPHGLEHMYSPILELFQLLRLSGNSRPRIAPGDILRITRPLKATEAVDKIYSLAALLNQDEDARGSNAPSLLREWLKHIDYTRTPEDVFEEVTRLIIKQENNLSILSAAGTAQRLSPAHISWVPDWSNSIISSADALDPRWCKAAGRTTPSHATATQQGCLDVSSLFHSVIAMHDSRSLSAAAENDILAPHTTSQVPVENPLPDVMNLWECIGKRFKSYPTGEAPVDAFWRTLLCNKIRGPDGVVTPTSSFRFSFFAAIAAMIPPLGAHTYNCVCSECLLNPVRSSTRRNVETEKGEGLIREFRKSESDPPGYQPAKHVQKLSKPTLDLSAHMNMDTSVTDLHDGDLNIFNPNPANQYVQSRDPLNNQIETLMNEIEDESLYYGELFVKSAAYTVPHLRLFATSTSHMGLGPPDMRVGDRVVILRGGPFPFIIRPRTNATETTLSPADEDRRADGSHDDITSERSGHRGPVMWTLVGPAYVHGISEGELLEDMEDPENDDSWQRVALH